MNERFCERGCVTGIDDWLKCWVKRWVRALEVIGIGLNVEQEA